tara:strand:+ start:369 stop:962 length:594 start_codon:yes stop_codon:yes gene_type:complete
MSFSYEHYKKTCKDFINAGYEFCSLEKRSSRRVYMVHDCDFFLEQAVTLAKHEHQIGIKSTYFVRLGAREYNLLNPFYKKMVHEIIDFGHDVGLHYEKIFDQTDIAYNICLLSKILKYPVRYFNVHEPVRTGIDFKNNTSKSNRAWNSPFFNTVKYISDSGGRWREGCFSKHINGYSELLINTHPVWWFDSTPTENY